MTMTMRREEARRKKEKLEEERKAKQLEEEKAKKKAETARRRAEEEAEAARDAKRAAKVLARKTEDADQMDIGEDASQTQGANVLGDHVNMSPEYARYLPYLKYKELNGQGRTKIPRK